MVNSLEVLFKRFNLNGIKYCILRKYEGLPFKIKGDIDILVEEKDFKKILETVRKEGFLYYPFTEPHFFFFKYCSEVGLIKLDITKRERILPRKKFKNFYIPKGSRDIRIKKSIVKKLKTRSKRLLHYSFSGKLICFEGPDGCGKSTLARSTKEVMSNYPIRSDLIYFGTKKWGKLYRILDLLRKILLIYKNKFLGRITFTDRYIHLTFRNYPILNKLVRILSPKPDRVYLLVAPVSVILDRKKELSPREIIDLYEYYAKLKHLRKIDSGEKVGKNLSFVINDVLKLIHMK